ncbi:MAG: substrate-binding domain-containing protein, partial [Spirochaetes bacterium]|nr:substrate-binding domain-containing protein [Spirochaetota bacterium]
PAKIKGRTADEAFSSIALKKAGFASRGDKSGTHMKEVEIWEKSAQKAPDKEKWYIQTGQGMINTINIAAERDAYTLTDRGTYITYESKQKECVPLVILVEGDKSLRNQYSVIAVNPEKCGDVKVDLTKELIKWLVSPDIQEFIGDFKMMNKQLFTPNAGK